MIKYKTDANESGVQLLPNRFACYLKKDDYRFIRKRHSYYRTVLEIGLIISLLASTILFQAWKRMERETKIAEKQLTEFIVEEIPVTEINQPASVPSRPTVPIASEDEDLPEDETIELTNLDLDDIPAPPPPPIVDDDVPIFVAFDEPPTPVGGYAAIMRNLVYPEIGRRSGVEGKVILHVKIDNEGKVGTIRVVQSLMDDFDKAAMDAVRSVKWIPAKQRDLPVTVWLMVPVTFQLLTEVQE